MPFGVPIQPFIWPPLPGLLLGQAGLRRCSCYCHQEEACHHRGGAWLVAAHPRVLVRHGRYTLRTSFPKNVNPLKRRVTVLVVTEILLPARLVSAWTNPVLKRVPGVVQVLALVCGLPCQVEVLACQVEVMKAFDLVPVWLPAGRCFVGQSVFGCQ